MVSLKMMKAEIFELFDEVTGLMITCKNDSIRKLSKEIVLTFIQNYPLSEALLEKIVLRLLNNMEFGEHEGRRAVLNVLERLIDKLPIEVFTKQAEVMVIAFTARLVNEDVLEIKEYATQIFKSLMEKNHQLWTQIQNIQNGVTPAADVTLETLEKQRLQLLDEIAASVRKAEA